MVVYFIDKPHFLVILTTLSSRMRRHGGINFHMKGWNRGDLAAFKMILVVFSQLVRRSGYFGVSGQNCDTTTSIQFNGPYFLQERIFYPLRHIVWIFGYFFVAHALNFGISFSGPKSRCHCHMKWVKFSRATWQHYGCFLAIFIFHRACADVAIYEFSLIILTPSFDSLSPICLQGAIFQPF